MLEAPSPLTYYVMYKWFLTCRFSLVVCRSAGPQILGYVGDRVEGYVAQTGGLDIEPGFLRCDSGKTNNPLRSLYLPFPFFVDLEPIPENI